jgi:hypothetical protein
MKVAEGALYSEAIPVNGIAVRKFRDYEEQCGRADTVADAA